MNVAPATVETNSRIKVSKLSKLTGAERREVALRLLKKFSEIPLSLGLFPSELANRKGILAFRDLGFSDDSPEVQTFVEIQILVPFRRKGINYYIEISSFEAEELDGPPIRKYRFSVAQKIELPCPDIKTSPKDYAVSLGSFIILKEAPRMEVIINGKLTLDEINRALLEMVIARSRTK